MYQYLTYLPKKYDKTKEYPLLIFLHGTPQRGDDINIVKKTALPYELEKKNLKLEMIVVAPQCPTADSWDTKLLYDFFLDVYKKYSINTKRIYLTGFSMGGFGALKFARDYPKIFAAVAPVCSGGTKYVAQDLKHIPFWFFHGKKDFIIEISKTEELVDELKRLNAEVKFTIYEDLGHDIWTVVYKEKELYEWFLVHEL